MLLVEDVIQSDVDDRCGCVFKLGEDWEEERDGERYLNTISLSRRLVVVRKVGAVIALLIGLQVKNDKKDVQARTARQRGRA